MYISDSKLRLRFGMDSKNRQSKDINFASFYRPRNEASEGYVFTGVCHSLCSGGGRWHQMHHGIGHMVTRGRWSGPTGKVEVLVRGWTSPPIPNPSWTPPWDTPLPPPTHTHRKVENQEIGSMSGRYASYWNAFLSGQINSFELCPSLTSECTMYSNQLSKSRSAQWQQNY